MGQAFSPRIRASRWPMRRRARRHCVSAGALALRATGAGEGFRATDVRVTLGETTTTATLGKIDPDNGTQRTLGPGTLKFLRQRQAAFGGFGTVQGVFSKADARLTRSDSWRLWWGRRYARSAADDLSMRWRRWTGCRGAACARANMNMSAQQLDVGNSQHPGAYEAMPVGETRLAVVRPFLAGGWNWARTGCWRAAIRDRRRRPLNPDWKLGGVPTALPGSGPSGHGERLRLRDQRAERGGTDGVVGGRIGSVGDSGWNSGAGTAYLPDLHVDAAGAFHKCGQAAAGESGGLADHEAGGNVPLLLA